MPCRPHQAQQRASRVVFPALSLVRISRGWGKLSLNAHVKVECYSTYRVQTRCRAKQGSLLTEILAREPSI